MITSYEAAVFCKQFSEFGSLGIVAEIRTHAWHMPSPLGGDFADIRWKIFSQPIPMLVTESGLREGDTYHAEFLPGSELLAQHKFMNEPDLVRVVAVTHGVGARALKKWVVDAAAKLYEMVQERVVRILDCDSQSRGGDVNGDGRLDAFDIQPFVECLFP